MQPGHKPAPRENYTWVKQESHQATGATRPLPVMFWSERQLANIPTTQNPSPSRS